jgi:hypothetical protein
LHARLVVARACAHNCDARHGAAQVEEQLKRLAAEAEAQKKAEAEQAAKVFRTNLVVLCHCARCATHLPAVRSCLRNFTVCRRVFLCVCACLHTSWLAASPSAFLHACCGFQIEAEIAREAAAALSKKPTESPTESPTGSPTGSVGTKAEAAENASKTPTAPVVKSDSKSLSTVTDTPADNVKRSSQVEIAAVAAIASVIALVIIGVAVATFRAHKLRKGDETKDLMESLLAPNMRDAVPQAQQTPVLH